MGVKKMPKISKETYNLIEKREPNNKIWMKMKGDWKLHPFHEREILTTWDYNFLKEICEFLTKMHEEEICEIRSCLASLESFDDNTIESLVEREAEVLKNKLRRVHKNSTICDKINQLIKRRFI